VLGALIKSQQLEIVLQSKAFSGSAERTYLVPLQLRARDWLVMSAAAVIVAVALILRFTYGVGSFHGPM
jgi:energy-coupling factor transport system permease protein